MNNKIIGSLVIFLIFISINFSFAFGEYNGIPESLFKSNDSVIYFNNPPNPASNPYPANNSLNIDVYTNISWIGSDPDVGDTLTYNIFFGVNSNPPNIEVVYPLNEFDPGILNYNTQYFWRIDTYDDQGGASTGPLWTFTTKDDTPPFTPSNPDPLNNSFNVSIYANLSWEGDDPDGDNVTYDVYFGILSNPPLVESDYVNSSFDPGILSYNTQYFWRIESEDTYGYSTLGPIWTFTTKENPPPYIAYNPLPENESTNIHIDAILSWEGGDPDGDNVTYDVYFGDNENPSLVDSNQTDNNYQPIVMNTTTSYYWRIITWDSLGKSSIGPLWNFKTSIYQNSPPEKPNTPEGPTTGRTGISYSYSSSTTDSNGEPIFYMFDWDDGTLSEWIGPFDSGQTITTSHTWSIKGSYAVKVKAKDIYGGESFWSDPLTISMPKSNLINFNFFKEILRDININWIFRFFNI